MGGSFQESLDRAKAYADAGADIIFPEGLTSADEIAAMVDALDVPISYNRTGVSPMLSLAELEQLGVRMVANAIGAFRASSRALWDHLGEAEGPPAQIAPQARLERFLQAESQE